MKINRINSNTTKQTTLKNQTKTTITKQNQGASLPIFHYPNNYFLSFEKRVDKDIVSWEERNKEKMPTTTKNCLVAMSEAKKMGFSPLEIRQKAFEYLNICETVDDIHSLFPDEELFQNIKSANEIRPHNNLIREIKTMKPTLEECGETILQNENDLTVYLIKKIYLEAKSLHEINQDLDNDLNPVFKNKDKNYINRSTIKSLGIETPKDQNSLRYTIDGYADSQGELISIAYSMLSDSKKEEILKARQETLSQKSKESLDITYEKLSQAQKSYWQSLSKEEYEKRIEQLKEGRENHWNNLTAEEKTDYIEKLQTSGAKQRIIMINAWNNCPEVRIALSNMLKGENYSDVSDIIYTTNLYTSVLSRLMTLFWAKNPNYAEKIGKEISKSNIEYTQAEANDELEEFTKKVLDNQTKIKKELKNEIEKTPKKETKIQTTPQNIQIENSEDAKKIELLKNYCKDCGYLPKDYLEEIVQCLSTKDLKEVEAFISATTTGKENFQKISEIIHSLGNNSDITDKITALNYAIQIEIQDCIKQDKSGFKPQYVFDDILEAYRILYQIKHQGKNFQFEPQLFYNKTTEFLQNASLQDEAFIRNTKIPKDYNYVLDANPDKKSIKRTYSEFLQSTSESNKEKIKNNIGKYFEYYSPDEKDKKINNIIADLGIFSNIYAKNNYQDYLNCAVEVNKRIKPENLEEFDRKIAEFVFQNYCRNIILRFH